jgi:hypothetical protein
MRVPFTSACKPLPILRNRFLSIDDVSYRFIVDRGPSTGYSTLRDVPLRRYEYSAEATERSVEPMHVGAISLHPAIFIPLQVRYVN